MGALGSVEVDVVVVGAGLSGLVAARDLVVGGVKRLLVLEARDRVGGRLDQAVRSNGKVLMRGGEFTGPPQRQLRSLAHELGITVEPMPPSDSGDVVRIFAGRRHVERHVLASDEVGRRALVAATEQLDEMAASVPAKTPWNAARAEEWDHQSIGQWLNSAVPSPAAREVLSGDLVSFGDVAQTSLLSLLWTISKLGGWASWEIAMSERFVGGTAQIPRRIAGQLGDRISLSRPVRRVEHDANRVVVHFDGGVASARAVVLATEPGQVDKIDFSPSLPHARHLLQARWLAGHAAKYIAIYDRPFWRDQGLSGRALGPRPLPKTIDVSPCDGEEGILIAPYGAGATTTGGFSEALSDPARARALVLDTLKLYFGRDAAHPVELHAFDWSGDHWSRGCGTQLPLGVLSGLGSVLREPIGRIIWAGADTGDQDWMEGAVTSGQRAASEALRWVDAAGRDGA